MNGGTSIMIVVYTQDATFIKKDPDVARDMIISIYGEKLGSEAYMALKNARPGTSWRKNGGPLLRVVTEKEADEIRKKEMTIGMISV